jgi:hypothetical protein
MPAISLREAQRVCAALSPRSPSESLTRGRACVRVLRGIACTLRRGKSLSEKPRCAKDTPLFRYSGYSVTERGADRCPVRECQQDPCLVCAFAFHTKSVSPNRPEKLRAPRSPVPHVARSHPDSATAVLYFAAGGSPPPLAPWDRDITSERALRYAQILYVDCRTVPIICHHRVA